MFPFDNIGNYRPYSNGCSSLSLLGNSKHIYSQDFGGILLIIFLSNNIVCEFCLLLLFRFYSHIHLGLFGGDLAKSAFCVELFIYLVLVLADT